MKNKMACDNSSQGNSKLKLKDYYKSGNIYEFLEHEDICQEPHQPEVQLTYVCEECYFGCWEDPGDVCPKCKTNFSITVDFDRREIECSGSKPPIGSEFWLPYHWEEFWNEIEERCDYIADQACIAYEKRMERLTRKEEIKEFNY